MDISYIKNQLEPFEKDLIEAQNWYEAKAIELLTEELYKYLLDRPSFNISYHYYQTFDGWTEFKTYNDCQLSAGEMITNLVELQIQHGNDWVFYVESASGIPEYFVQFNGYEFYYDDMGWE